MLCCLLDSEVTIAPFRLQLILLMFQVLFFDKPFTIILQEMCITLSIY